MILSIIIAMIATLKQAVLRIYYSITNRYSLPTIAAIIITVLVIVYPQQIYIYNVPIITWFMKQRLVSVSLLFLVLSGVTNWRNGYKLSVLYLVMVILSSTFSFAWIVVFTLFTILALIILKKMN